jgi:hypothetical protein
MFVTFTTPENRIYVTTKEGESRFKEEFIQDNSEKDFEELDRVEIDHYLLRIDMGIPSVSFG